MMNRRDFLAASIAIATNRALAQAAGFGTHLRFAHRQTQIVAPPGVSIFEFASEIHGLDGLELQIIWKGNNLGDFSNGLAAGYKSESKRTGIDIPSISGIWKPGEKIFDIPTAEAAITNAIRTADFFGARTILIALYTVNCPDMNDTSSFEPVVSLLQKMAPLAASANVTLGLETSLSAPDELKFLTLIDKPNVRSYYDAANEQQYHPGHAIEGIGILGPRIVQCHFKNGTELLSSPTSTLDWRADLAALKHIHYNGWFVFETTHSSPEQCIEATKSNIAFIHGEMQG